MDKVPEYAEEIYDKLDDPHISIGKKLLWLEEYIRTIIKENRAYEQERFKKEE